MAPTLFTSCHALPPEGARFALGRPGGETLAPTLFTSCNALPPEGARFALGRPGGETLAPTRFTSCHALPSAGALRLRLGKAGSAAPACTISLAPLAARWISE